MSRVEDATENRHIQFIWIKLPLRSLLLLPRCLWICFATLGFFWSSHNNNKQKIPRTHTHTIAGEHCGSIPHRFYCLLHIETQSLMQTSLDSNRPPSPQNIPCRVYHAHTHLRPISMVYYLVWPRDRAQHFFDRIAHFCSVNCGVCLKCPSLFGLRIIHWLETVMDFVCFATATMCQFGSSQQSACTWTYSRTFPHWRMLI